MNKPGRGLLTWGLKAVRANRVQIICSGVLAALLIGASTHASPLHLANMSLAEAIDDALVPTAVEESIYLYGEAPELDAIGASYLIFAAYGEQVRGAIFRPYSSFDCFEGRLTDEALALEITNSYTQESYTYAIALAAEGNLANSAGGASPTLYLEGFHNLGEPRESELSILGVCEGNASSQPKIEI
ncbi:MAG: hypothetical protein AAGH78_05340 [Cyanobacteria bacterium P01_H01_bin.58]